MDFGSPHETELTSRFNKPVFVYGYPTQVKAFYMEPWPGRAEVCKSVDLLAPEGYGEIIGGSERISDESLLLQRLNEHNLPVELVQMVPGIATVWKCPTQWFWTGYRTIGYMDLRDQSYSRDNRLPAHH